MNRSIHRLSNPRWAKMRVGAAIVASILLLPFLLVALLPMLLMFVPIAVVGIPVIVPVMLSGTLAARWEDDKRLSRAPVPRQAPRAVVVR